MRGVGSLKYKAETALPEAQKRREEISRSEDSRNADQRSGLFQVWQDEQQAGILEEEARRGMDDKLYALKSQVDGLK